MEQDQTPTNGSRKKLQLQKPNNKVIFGVFALFAIALIFIFVYIFVLQEQEEDTTNQESTTSNTTKQSPLYLSLIYI